MRFVNLNSVFFTVQGEGANAGRRALFVRMPFCDLKCPWCDTEFNSFTPWPAAQLMEFAETMSCDLAVITGGEPSMNKHAPVVVEILRKIGYEVAMESNGRHPPPDVDWLTVSPKPFQRDPYWVHPDAFRRADEFKYVVDRDFDFRVLDRHGKEFSKLTYFDGPAVRDVASDQHHDSVPVVEVYNQRAKLFLSPEFGDMKTNVRRIMEYQARRPWWRLSLQTHKWIEVP